MIELFTGLAFVVGWLVTVFGKCFDFIITDYINNGVFLDALYKNLFVFLMFGRLYAIIFWNDTMKENRRILVSFALFIGCFASFGLELFANITNNNVLGIITLVIGAVIFLLVKIVTLKKYWKVFGKKYFVWHLADVIVAGAMLAILILGQPAQGMLFILITLLIVLWGINQHIQFIQPYWATEQTFDDLIRFAIINNDFDCLCEKTKLKNITDNIIYSECSTLLKYSVDRIKMIKKITKRVEGIFIKEGLGKKKILMMKRNMTLNLINNLMNRPLDYWRMIPYIRTLFQEFVRNRERYGKKRIWLP